jgi:excisionase family DNA binding protein
MNNDLQQMADHIAEKLSYCHKEVLTSDEAAKYMGISISTLYKWTMRKQIPHSKPNGKVCYFNRLELENWLMSNRVATADELQDMAQAYCAHTHNNRKGTL